LGVSKHARGGGGGGNFNSHEYQEISTLVTKEIKSREFSFSFKEKFPFIKKD